MGVGHVDRDPEALGAP